MYEPGSSIPVGADLQKVPKAYVSDLASVSEVRTFFGYNQFIFIICRQLKIWLHLHLPGSNMRDCARGD